MAAYQGVDPDWFTNKPLIYWEYALIRYNAHHEAKRQINERNNKRGA